MHKFAIADFIVKENLECSRSDWVFNSNKERICAIYSFDKKDKPIFRYQEDAPKEGYITSVRYNRQNKIYSIFYNKKANGHYAQNFNTKTSINTGVDDDMDEIDNDPFNDLNVDIILLSSTDYDGNEITSINEPLYVDTKYLKYTFKYSKKSRAAKKYEIGIKIINPMREALLGSKSTEGFSRK